MISDQEFGRLMFNDLEDQGDYCLINDQGDY